NVLFFHNYDPDANPDEVFAAHRRWGEMHHAARMSHDNDCNPDRRLRIGYISPDLRKHAVTRYLEPVFVHHDPAAVEIYCYAEVPYPDSVTSRLQSLAQGWHWTCKMSNDEVAAQISADQLTSW